MSHILFGRSLTSRTPDRSVNWFTFNRLPPVRLHRATIYYTDQVRKNLIHSVHHKDSQSAVYPSAFNLLHSYGTDLVLYLKFANNGAKVALY